MTIIWLWKNLVFQITPENTWELINYMVMVF